MNLHSSLARDVASMMAMAVLLSLAGPNSAPAEPLYHFKLSVTGGVYPIVSGLTDLPDNTTLFVNVKKPWLIDGQQRVDRGVSACGDDCLPATGPDHQLGIRTVVKKGHFEAGPFSFNEAPFKYATYPLELYVSPNLSTATTEQIKALGTPIYKTEIRVKPDEEENSAGKSGPSHVLTFHGRCDVTLPDLPTITCIPDVMLIINRGHSALIFTYAGGDGQNTTFTLAGSHDRQPNAENYYLSVDTLETTFHTKKTITNKTEGECLFRLNEAGSTYYFIRCTIYDRRNSLIFKFNLDPIQYSDAKTFN